MKFQVPAIFGITAKFKVKNYAKTFFLCFLIGGSAETFQYFFNRDASLYDLFRDSLGAFSGILLFISIDTAIHLNRVTKRFLMTAGFLVLLFLSFSFLKSVYYTLEAKREFPQLFSFEHTWESLFISCNNATLENISPKGLWNSNESNAVTRITLGNGKYPGIIFEDFYPDWSSMDTFKMSIFCPIDTCFVLDLRINDSKHNDEGHDRYNAKLSIHQGENTWSIPTNIIKAAPAGREMDLSKVAAIVLFDREQGNGKSFLLDSMYLVKAHSRLSSEIVATGQCSKAK